MNLKSVSIVLFVFFISACNCVLSEQNDIAEARGKKKKIALFVYWADLIIKKIFVLKLIYAFVFWIVIHKAGYFLTWFVSYLKDKKKEHHDHHDYHDHHAHYVSHDYGPPNSYGPPSSYGTPSSYGPPSSYIPSGSYGAPSKYGPYNRQSHGV